MSALAQRLGTIFPRWRSPRAVEDEVRAEIEFHLDQATRELTDAGLEPEAARAQALARFGDPEAAIAACRRIHTEDQAMLARTLAIALAVTILVSLGLGMLLIRRAKAAELAALDQRMRAEEALHHTLAERERAEQVRQDQEQQMREVTESRLKANELAQAEKERADKLEEAARAWGVDQLPLDARGWLQQFLSNPEDWRHGLSIANRLARLPGDAPIEILEEIWAELPPAHRAQVLRPFLSNPTHPRALRLLELATRDSEPTVRERAWLHMRDFALEDFSASPELGLAWLREHSSFSLAQTLERAASRFTDRLQGASEEQIEMALELLERASPGPWKTAGLDRTAVLRSCGLIEMLTSPRMLGSDAHAERALRVLATLDFDEGQQRSLFLPYLAEGSSLGMTATGASALGRRGNTWAVPHLLACLDRQVSQAEAGTGGTFAVAMALGEIGDRSVIPALIARIQAEESYATVYGIGYFALGKLTGVGYHESHGAAFWTQWLAENAASLPPPSGK